MRAVLAWFPVAVFVLAVAVLVWRVPAVVVRKYFAAFASRHGVGMQLGVTILATMMLAIIVASLVEPGRRPVMEQVDAAVVVLGLSAGALDLRRFCRARRNRPHP